MTPDEALAFLDRHTNLGISPGLERMQAAMRLLGEPQTAYQAVHVAGTNGKTSVAHLVDAGLRAHGLSVGRYTSPHLVSPYERVAVNGTPIGPEDFAGAMAYLAPVIDQVESETGTRPTYFEIGTTLALSWFADSAVDVAVVEVGLGGAFDATNVVDAQVAVLTNVSVDHAEFLGDDVVGICREKAGIVKAGSHVVTGVEEPDLLDVVEERAADVGADAVWQLGRDVRVLRTSVGHGGVVLDVETPFGGYDGLFVPLLGFHQATNAALAIGALEAFFGRGLDFDVLQEGLREVAVPARLEVMRRQPLVLVDAAHNPAGSVSLAEAVDEYFEAVRPLVLVVGILADKDVDGVLAPLLQRSTEVVVAAPDSPRALAPEALAARVTALAPGTAVSIAGSMAGAVERAMAAAGSDGAVLVTGSVLTAGEARHHLEAI